MPLLGLEQRTCGGKRVAGADRVDRGDSGPEHSLDKRGRHLARANEPPLSTRDGFRQIAGSLIHPRRPSRYLAPSRLIANVQNRALHDD